MLLTRYILSVCQKTLILPCRDVGANTVRPPTQRSNAFSGKFFTWQMGTGAQCAPLQGFFSTAGYVIMYIFYIFHISYFILPGSGKNEICNGMPGKYIGSFQGILNDTLKLQMYLPVGNWATNARPHGASALGGAQRAPPSRKAGPLVRFKAPLGR